MHNENYEITSREFIDRWYFLIILCTVTLFPYLLSIVTDTEYYFFLGLFILIVFIIGIKNFTASLMFIPIVLMNPYTLEETKTNLHISEVILLVIFVLWVIRIISLNEKFLFPVKFKLPVIILVTFGVMSIITARNITATILQLIRYIEILIILIMIVYNHISKPKQIRLFFILLIIGGLFASIVGIEQFMTGTLVKGDTRRVFGWHGGGYGAILGSTIIMSISVLVYDKSKWIKILALITIPFSFIALILSQTRTWLMALLISIVLTFILGDKYFLRKFIYFVIILFIFVTLLISTNGFGLLNERWFDIVFKSAIGLNRPSGKTAFEDFSILLRFNVWKYSIEQTIIHPITGIGLGNLRFKDYINVRLGEPGEGVGYVDNQYIQFFAEAGVLAGIAWILFTIRAVQSGFVSISYFKGTKYEAVVRGLYGSLLILVIGSFFWVITPHHELFALFVIISVFLVRIENNLRFEKKI